MGFLNPILLVATAGVLVPIIIHLLNRFRHRQVDWGAMELLRRAVVMRSRRIRIEDIIILLLRCLAVLLLALAIARPTITTSGARWFGGSRQVGAVIAIDGSYSMAYEPGVASRFDRAMESLSQVRKTLSAGDPVSLVVMGNEPRTLLRHASYDERRLTKELEKVSPLPERLNLDRCLDKVASLMMEMKAPVRECYLLTDAQKLTWENLSPKARQALEEIGRVGKVFYLPTPADSGENLAVTSFEMESGALRRGTMARYVAEVRNTGLRPRMDVPVRLFVGGEQVPVYRRTVERIDPGQTVAVPLFARFQAAGDIKVSADIGRDALMMDNIRHAVARVREKVKVLCVDGSPDPLRRPYHNGTDFLAAALSPTTPAQQAAASLVVDNVPYQQLGARSLDDYDVVMLSNVADVRGQEVGKLWTFVNHGGGLIVFLGGNTIPRLINARMRQGEQTLLPAEVMETVTAPQAGRSGLDPAAPAGWGIEPARMIHPLGRIFTLLPPPLLAEARVTKAFKLRVLPGGQDILKLAGGDTALLAERAVGRGKVLLFSSTANRDWTNFIVHPVGPMFLHEAVSYLTGRGEGGSSIVGEPLICPLNDQVVGTTVQFRDPEGVMLPVQVTERDGQTIAEYTKSGPAGFYEVSSAEGVQPRVLAANVDPTESDVRVLDSDRLSAAMSRLPVRVLAGSDDLAATIRESRVGFELWMYLMIAGLGVLLIEGLLAWWFSRAMASAETLELRSAKQQLRAAESAA